MTFLGEKILPYKQIESDNGYVWVGINHAKAPVLEEMSRISGEQWIRLNSTDDDIRKNAKAVNKERAEIMLQRNNRLTEYMRWQALRGSLEVTTRDESNLVQYKVGKPVALVPWTDVENSSPVSDLRAFAVYGYKFIMNSKTYALLAKDKRFHDTDISIRCVINDNGYRTDGKDPTNVQFVQDGEVFIVPTDGTVGYTAEVDHKIGKPNSTDILIVYGNQTEVMIDVMTRNHYIRVAASRIPVITNRTFYLKAF